MKLNELVAEPLGSSALRGCATSRAQILGKSPVVISLCAEPWLFKCHDRLNVHLRPRHPPGGRQFQSWDRMLGLHVVRARYLIVWGRRSDMPGTKISIASRTASAARKGTIPR